MVVRGVENLAEFLNKYQTKRGSKTRVVDTGISPRKERGAYEIETSETAL